jgi:DNA-binding MarR family transcriptional regulator
LLIPGYDISVILDILDSVSDRSKVVSTAIADPRGITSSTVDVLLDSMLGRNYIKRKNGKLFLAESGLKLRNSLREYLNVPIPNNIS